MANLQIIKELAKERNYPLEQLANDLGITAQALSKIMRENSTKVSTLERIAQLLRVSVRIFFDESETNRVAIADNSSLAISGDNNTLSNESEQLIKLVTRQQEHIEKLTNKQSEQIDRLLSIIEAMNK